MKTDNLAEVFVTDERVDEIYNKYNYNFPKKLDDNQQRVGKTTAHI